MNSNAVKNIPASIRARLYNKSKELNRPFLEILQYYAMERFLYRLSISEFANQFYLKGALMLRVWNPDMHRATMDIDMLAKTSNQPDNLEQICKKICTISSTADGIEFGAKLNQAKIAMQIDVGFGDIISPAPQSFTFPTLLDLPPPRLAGYTPESVIAEKLEIMIKRGLANSRMKDFYDIWFLLRASLIQKNNLQDAIQKTFNHRGTTLSTSPICFTSYFANHPNKIAQWNAWVQKFKIPTPIALPELIIELRDCLQPLLEEISKRKAEF